MIIRTKNIFVCSMVVIVAIFFSSLSLCQSEAQISIPFEIYDNSGGQKILYFGLDQTATNGIDFLLGESDLPPYPPTGAFDARWLLPQNGFNGSLSSLLDYRNAPGFPYSGTVEHRFRYQSAGGATAMFFSWNLPETVTGLVQDLSNGTLINVPITGSGTYQIINFDDINRLKLMVYYNNIVLDAENQAEIHSEFILEQNYPNPFNPNTVISYKLPVSGNITLKVYDVLGNGVVTLVDEYKPAGIYEVEFSSHSGLLASPELSGGGSGISDLPSGIYIYELRTEKYVAMKKMILLK